MGNPLMQLDCILIINKRNFVALMTRSMSDSHHHPHHSPQAPDGAPGDHRVDTLLGTARFRLMGVALVCAVMWFALWLAVRVA